MRGGEDLEREFKELEASVVGPATQNFGGDARVVQGIAKLGRAIVRPSSTTTFLSYVNIVLGVLILLATVIQIVLRLQGK